MTNIAHLLSESSVFCFDTIAILFTGMSLAVSQAPDAPVELGRVQFLRSLDQGLARSKEHGRVVFTLFQEIPG